MEFRKSSYSTHATSSCVEAGASAWLAPSYSHANGNCVEAAGAAFTASARCDVNGSCVEAGGARFAKAGNSNFNGNCVEAGTVPFAKARASIYNGNCVEAGTADFASASASGGTNCAEAGDHAGMVFLRDSKDPRCETADFPHLHFTRDEWGSGRAVKFTPVSGLAVPAGIRAVASARGHDPAVAWYAVVTLRKEDHETILYFDQAEKDAWDKGVDNGEFTLAVPVAA
jgi:hypothetical protein